MQFSCAKTTPFASLRGRPLRRVVIGAAKIAYVLALISTLIFPSVTHARDVSHRFPRTANYYLRWELNETEARALAKWDVVILDMEIQRAPDLMRLMRQINPNIILLAYITPEEIRDDTANFSGYLRQELAQQIPERWYLHSSGGRRLTWWPRTHLLNAADGSPTVSGQQWNMFLAQFVSRRILGSGLWDGVFYDNAWNNIRYFAGPDVDINGDGVIDANMDEVWRSGMRALFSETRRLTNDQYLIVANGTSGGRTYSDLLNGVMLENFVPAGWSRDMQTYAYNQTATKNKRINIINANTGNGGAEDYARMRFGLASTLLHDGYYSYDYGDQNHGQTWEYDEYGVDLGSPARAAQSMDGQSMYAAGVWRREFDHGIAVVNSAADAREVDLGGEYEKIHGVEDVLVNDGSIVSSASLNGYDGLILLKTFTTLNDILFPNGGFVRFFHPDGTRARNGLFLFEEGQPAGEQIAHVDVDGDGSRDLIMVSGNKIAAWRSDGQPYFALYPYSANYFGNLRVAYGDVNGDRHMEIFVAPAEGYPAPIKAYSFSGDLLHGGWFPFGAKYKGGYSIALGNIDGSGKDKIIIGSGKGMPPRVAVYTDTHRQISSWLPFEKTFQGGVSVAAGDITGSGAESIVVGAGPGKKPVIRVFDPFGKLLYKEFTAYRTIGNPGIHVATVDADFDGKSEIVGISKDIGN